MDGVKHVPGIELGEQPRLECRSSLFVAHSFSMCSAVIGAYRVFMLPRCA
jgi:hypothetical protein